MDLRTFGWDDFFEEHFAVYRAEGAGVGRVFLEHGKNYGLYTAHGEVRAEMSGRLRYQAATREGFPAVGDWVVLRRSTGREHLTIQAVLPRKSKFSRKMAGARAAEQVVAANVNTVFLVNGLDQDFSLRRIERYLIMAWESGAAPVIVLNKTDLCADLERRITQVQAVSLAAPVLCLSGKKHEGIEPLQAYLQKGQTVALLGSSGVGKSTLVNCLLGQEVQKTQSVRQGDDQGKHTTTRRQLILTPTGGLLIDTPGMRELQLWVGDDGLLDTFKDIEALSLECRFSNCSHETEDGCSIRKALEDHTLDVLRYESFLKLQQELDVLSSRQKQKAAPARKDQPKKTVTAYNRTNRRLRRDDDDEPEW